ncbi:GNAT family N-acetyltransferase [Vibrio sp. TBV020]|uniref:GNAT family N-acetyltransferase n=1 Tax=Vibrio sp. TBV020 TaxID=3137398 RepID=UPI0038CD480A
MSFSISTDHLILRDFTEEDSKHYVNQCQDPKYQRFYSEEDCSVEKSGQLASLFRQQAAEQPRKQFHLAITDKASGDYLGIAALRIEGDQQASVGCGLIRGKQGKGVSEEAMAALLSYGFEHLDVHRAYAETLSKNKAAIKLCQRLGMRIEAQFRQNRYFKENWWDTTVLAILRQEWLVPDLMS